jgi:hypothetical protein
MVGSAPKPENCARDKLRKRSERGSLRRSGGHEDAEEGQKASGCVKPGRLRFCGVCHSMAVRAPIAEDATVIRKAIRGLLACEPNIEVGGEPAKFPRLLTWLPAVYLVFDSA